MLSRLVIYDTVFYKWTLHGLRCLRRNHAVVVNFKVLIPTQMVVSDLSELKSIEFDFFVSLNKVTLSLIKLYLHLHKLLFILVFQVLTLLILRFFGFHQY